MKKKIKYYLLLFLIILIFFEPIYEYFKINLFNHINKNKILKEQKKITILFRNDDLSFNTDIIKESMIVEIFNKYNIKPIYAIIPKVHGKEIGLNVLVTDSIIKWISENKIIPALHGLSHKMNKHNAGEFKGLSYKEQFEMIKEGKDYLDSLLHTDIKIFCPPWNQADENTLLACKNNGIVIFSGFLHSSIVEGMKYLNSTSDLFEGSLGTVNEALSIANASKYNSNHIILFHSSYNFNEDNLYKLDSLLEYLSKFPQYLLIDCNFRALSQLDKIDEYIYSELEYIENKYSEFRILKFFLMKLGLDRRADFLKDYQKGVWSGDIAMQFSSIKSFLFHSLILLTFNRILIFMFLYGFFLLVKKILKNNKNE